MQATVYYSPEAVGSLASLFFDGRYLYSRVHGLGSLGALDGFLKKIGKKLKKTVKAVGKGVKKVAKTSVKVIKKALPIVNQALTFIPGVGWAAKAALTVAEEGFKAIDKAKAKKLQKKQMQAVEQPAPVKVVPVKPVAAATQTAVTKSVSLPTTSPARKSLPVYGMRDFLTINNAVARNQVGAVITSYSIHYTKLYDLDKRC